MKAVVLVGGLSTQLRPLTLTVPLPLLQFCNQTLLSHQLQALKDAGISEVIICYRETAGVPKMWEEAISQLEQELRIRITCSREEREMGTAGALKLAEPLITDGGANDAPFIVVNADVLCSYPLRDLLRVHVKHGRQGTVLTTRTDTPSEYGVVVSDERTGRVLHFVEKPETYVSELINAGVYAFSPSIFSLIRADCAVSMNEVLPRMAQDEQLHSMLLTGYWVKLRTPLSFMEAVHAHLEISRFMSPGQLTSSVDGYTTKGNVMVHPTAKIGRGCVLGPSVVIGPKCVVEDGVRLEDVTLLEGVTVRSHALVKNSLIGWSSVIGRWCYVIGSVFGESVSVKDTILLNGATVLPHKELRGNIRNPEIVI
mmetsp:Transcript_22439/g.49002  ORF Transcript_22439/g.49002 Transcript_22439/m.49002 type:complete len:369 (-) Transcript_22439:306-1412(-)